VYAKKITLTKKCWQVGANKVISALTAGFTGCKG
jgi:hypothetical protein